MAEPENQSASHRPARRDLCWVVSDGTAGMENQALGLAEAVGLPISVKRATPPAALHALPSALWPPLIRMQPRLALWGEGGEDLAPPWPSLLIASGRQSIPLSLAVKRLSGNRTFTVQTQHPRIGPRHFDLVVPPYHDLLSGPNVEPIIGAPNRIAAAKIEEESKRVAPLLAHLPRPLVAVLIGGKSKVYDFPPERMDALCEDLLILMRQHDVGLAITTSRRTGKELKRLLHQRLDGERIYIWDEAGHNPYFGMLGLADVILVTADSTNMVTEAATTGKPVYVVPLPGGSAKFRRFHRDLEEYGATRPFTGAIDTWHYRPLNETQRVAKIIRARLDGRGGAAADL